MSRYDDRHWLLAKLQASSRPNGQVAAQATSSEASSDPHAHAEPTSPIMSLHYAMHVCANGRPSLAAHLKVYSYIVPKIPVKLGVEAYINDA